MGRQDLFYYDKSRVFTPLTLYVIICIIIIQPYTTKYLMGGKQTKKCGKFFLEELICFAHYKEFIRNLKRRCFKAASFFITWEAAWNHTQFRVSRTECQVRLRFSKRKIFLSSGILRN